MCRLITDPTLQPASPASPAFEQETARLVAVLREVFSQLIRLLPGPIRTASDLQRATRLDMKLCWKVFKVAGAEEGLSAAQYVPGPANTKDLLKTFKRLGAPEPLLERLGQVAAQFDRLVLEHAPDRRTFDSMVGSFGSIGSERADLRERRSAFQAGSHIFGVHLQTAIMTLIQRPGQTAGRLDEIGLRSEFGLRRLRPSGIPLFQFAYATFDKDGNDYSAGRRRPLSGDADGSPDEGMGLIREFCSAPCPEVTVNRLADGRCVGTLMHGELGIKASLDLVAGFIFRDSAPRFRAKGESHCWSALAITRPVRTAIIDLVVEEGTLSQDIRPRGFMTARNNMVPPPHEMWSSQQLSPGEPALRLGRGPATLLTPEAPRYADLVEWSIRRAGWDPERFETWRVRVEYPVTLSTVGIVYELPIQAD